MQMQAEAWDDLIIEDQEHGEGNDQTTLGLLFTHEILPEWKRRARGLTGPPAEGQDVAIPHKICQYLSLADLKSLSQVNPYTYLAVLGSRSFCEKAVCKVSDKWHREIVGSTTVAKGVKWRSYTFEHFAYHRHLHQFSSYWRKSASELLDLTVSQSSFECDGASFIFNESVKLNTLRLKECKLKHWSMVRAPIHQGPLMSANSGEDVEATRRMCAALKTLVLDDVQISPCMWQYLHQRCTALETLTIENCLNKPGTDEETMGLMIRNIKALIFRNVGTLKTLTIANNGFQIPFIQLVGTENANQEVLRLAINSLSISIPEELENSAALTVLLQRVTPDVTELTVSFDGRFSRATLEMFLSPVFATLIKLKLVVLGGEKFHRNLNVNEYVPIGPVLERCTALEYFSIVDSNEVPENDMKKAQGEKTTKKGPRPTPEQIVTAKGKIRTPLAFEMLEKLPESLKELSIKIRMTDEINLSNFDNLRLLKAYQNFTKLELSGPLFTPAIQGFKTIIKGMPRLKNLVLNSCGITDAVITGLSLAATQELRRTGGVALALYTDDPSFQNLLDSAQDYTAITARAAAAGGVALPPLQRRRARQLMRRRLVAAMNVPVAADDSDVSDDSDNEMDALEAEAGGVEVADNNAAAVNEDGGGDAQQNNAQAAPMELEGGNGDTRRYRILDLKDLEHLDLSNNFEVTDIGVFDSIRNPKLKVIKLSGCTRVTDAGLKSIAKFHPDLEELHCKDCRRLSQIGFDQTIKTCKNLKLIRTTKTVALNNMGITTYPKSPVYFDIVKFPRDVDA